MMNRAIPEQVEISSEDSSPAANDDVEECKQPNADYYLMDQPAKKLTSEGMESQSGDNVFLPQVPINQIPKVNQEFESHEEAYNFYNQYARAAGFSVRIANCKKNKETNETCWKLYVCSMEGKTNDTYQRKLKDSVPRAGERNRVHTRVGCNARLSVVKKQTGQFWVVSKFVEEHNHGLTSQSRVHLLRSHRNVSATKKALMQQFLEANIPTHQQVHLMEIDSGGASAIRCVEREIKNHESDHDAETLIEHFTFEKEKSLNFVFDFETDVDNKLLRCFWADSRSRRSYGYFGDVVMFDTIYNTNWYSMILATFIGVNHHGQTIIFACGLLSDETTESFVWLFSKFLEAMTNQPPPGLIITDQDVAISKAITMVLPFTLHRYCLWHILNKFSKKINVMSYTKQYHMLVSIIKESESPDEFEHRWTEVMESTNLDCNEWLSSMYEIRSRWVPAYFKNVFSAGMSSCQRSESDNSFLKKCVNRKNTLMGFITRFNRALAHQRHEELVANHIDLSEPKLASFLMMENQMVHIYTKKIFLLFQKEVEQSNLYICSKRSSSIDAKVYVVERFEPGKTSERQRELTYFTSTDFITCSCGMFEFHGYPCRHMLCYLKKKQVLLLPDKYIKRRWTKNVGAGSVYEPMVGLNGNDNSSQSLMARREILAYMASLLVDDASLTDARSTFLLNEFRQLHIKLKDIDNKANVGRSQSESRSREETQVVCDPNVVRAKGCWKRLNSSKEKALSESSRLCRSCGVNCQDKRTSSELHIRSNMLDDSYQPQHGHKDTHHDEREDATYWLLRRAEVYQEYMNLILVPSLRGSLIPFTSWIGLGRSMKQLYGQPLHYLTNISLKQWDQSRIGAKDEQIPLDTIIHPCKAEASIWLMEEVNRLTTSHHHLAKLWLADPMHHAFIDPIFPKLRA